MWRHGDVLIQKCKNVPPAAAELPHTILAKGELTGHAHRVEPRGASTLYRDGDSLYLRVTGPSVEVLHEEHATIKLDRGTYRVWIQREYSPEAIRRVVD